MTHPSAHTSPSLFLPKGLSALAENYDVVFSDIWGVVHNGDAHFGPAVEALARFRAGGGAVILITNAPRPSGPIREQLDMLGVPHTANDGLVTSGDVCLELIAARSGHSLYHIGPERDLSLYDEVARMGGSPRLAELDRADFAVCTGLTEDDHEVPDDYRATLETMLARNMPMICANPDIVVHRGDRLIYCAGALGQLYAQMGGTVIQAGKPYAPIYERCFALAKESLTARSGKDLVKSRVLTIGDAMATDVAGASLQGLDCLFITHGIHRDKTHKPGSSQLDEAHLLAFLQQYDHHPTSAMRELVW